MLPRKPTRVDLLPADQEQLEALRRQQQQQPVEDPLAALVQVRPRLWGCPVWAHGLISAARALFPHPHPHPSPCATQGNKRSVASRIGLAQPPQQQQRAQ